MLCMARAAVIRATMPAYMAPSIQQNVGSTIVACRFGNASIKASARNMGSIAFSLDHASAQYCKKHLCKRVGNCSQHWHAI